MGAFNRYRLDVERVGGELAPLLDGTLEAQVAGEVHRSINGTRGERRVRVDLNEMHGIHGVTCTICELPLRSLSITDSESMFASGPKLTERLKVRTLFDGESLWELLPEPTRSAIVELLLPASSSLTLAPRELSALLGPMGLLREADAPSKILASLDRLIAIAAAVEESWNVDPSKVGGGMGFMGRNYVPPPPPPPEPRPRKIAPCDAAAVAQAIHAAREKLLASCEIIEPFPVTDPLSRDRMEKKGKVVLLPPVPPTDWISDLTHRILPAGDAERGWYFARTKEDGFARVIAAAHRYEAATGVPLRSAPYTLIARVNGDPGLAVINKKGTFGLEVDTLGAQIGDHLFVDATQMVDGESRFTGEVVNAIAEARERVLCDADEIAQVVSAARNALLAAHARSIVEPFPAIDPLAVDPIARKGQVVVLPPTPPSRWVTRVIDKVVAVGDATRGWFLASTDDPGLARVIGAAARYEKATGLSLGDAPYTLVARVTGQAARAVIGGSRVGGLEVETLGAQIGDRLFVDATNVVDGLSRFAGEVV